MFSIYVIVKMSLFISLLGALLRHITFGNNQMLQKVEKPFFSVLLKKNLIFYLVRFCYKLTEKLFTSKTKFITRAIIVISSCFMGLGIGIRIAIISGIFIPHQTTFLLLFAINGLFRSIIHFGILLRTGGGGILRKLLNRAGANPNNIMSAAQTGGFGGDNNNNNSDYEQKTNQEQQNTATWTKWSAVGTWIGVGTAWYLGTGNAKEHGELIQRNRHLEWERDRYKRHGENMESLVETTRKHNSELEQRLEKLEKEKNIK